MGSSHVVGSLYIFKSPRVSISTTVSSSDRGQVEQQATWEARLVGISTGCDRLQGRVPLKITCRHASCVAFSRSLCALRAAASFLLLKPVNTHEDPTPYETLQQNKSF